MPVEIFHVKDSAGTSWSLEKDSPAGPRHPTLVCLHGYTGSGKDFKPLLQAMPDAAVNSICIDLPGHGNSRAENRIESFQLDNVLRTIGDICNEVPDSNKVVILGYSMGARIALHYLLEHPETKGILMSGSPGLKTEHERAQRRESDGAWVRKLQDENYSIETFCDEWESQPVILPQTTLAEPMASRLATRRRQNSKSELAMAMQAWGAGILPSLWDRLTGLQEQLLLAGEKDKKFCAIAAEMVRANPSLDLEIIPNTSHSPHLENPEAAARVITNYLSRI